jgi:glycolate oxidase FAD binding subunit
LPSVSDIPVRPGTLKEASALLAAASAEGRSLRIGRDLLTDGLDRVLEHEAGDLTCTVEAGLRLSQLRTRLAQHGQRLSLDPPGDPTVGACLAANQSGPLRHRFGAPRDLVLGVTLVLADGTIANAGGKVVKNVAGYDLGKLVCGSLGTLALIARVSLRLHPLPTAARTVVVETDRVGSMVETFLRSQLQPSALDVLHPGRVAVLFEGSPGAVEHQVTLAATLAGGEEADPGVWDEVRERQGAARGRLRFDPGRLEQALLSMGEGIVRPAAGVAYVPNETESDLPAAVRALNERIRARFDPTSVFAS